MKQRLKQFVVGTALFMFPIQPASGVIAKTDSLAFLEKQMATLDERDLIVFDMDDVLIVALDAILHLKVEPLLDKLHANYLDHLPKHQQLLLFSHVWRQAKTTLVSPIFPP